MLYIRGINENEGTLCIGNTLQGRTEWVAYAEAVNAVLSGSCIVGCVYNSIEELRRTRKFKSVNNQEEQKPLIIKVGEVKQVRGNTNNLKIYVAKTLDSIRDTFVSADYFEKEAVGFATEAVVTGIDYRYDILKLTTSKGYQCCVRNEQVSFQDVEVRKIRPEAYAYLNKLGEMAKEGQLVKNTAYLQRALDYCRTVT